MSQDQKYVINLGLASCNKWYPSSWPRLRALLWRTGRAMRSRSCGGRLAWTFHIPSPSFLNMTWSYWDAPQRVAFFSEGWNTKFNIRQQLTFTCSSQLTVLLAVTLSESQRPRNLISKSTRYSASLTSGGHPSSLIVFSLGEGDYVEVQCGHLPWHQVWHPQRPQHVLGNKFLNLPRFWRVVLWPQTQSDNVCTLFELNQHDVSMTVKSCGGHEATVTCVIFL